MTDPRTALEARLDEALDMLETACRETGGNGWFMGRLGKHPAMQELLRRAALAPVASPEAVWVGLESDPAWDEQAALPHDRPRSPRSEHASGDPSDLSLTPVGEGVSPVDGGQVPRWQDHACPDCGGFQFREYPHGEVGCPDIRCRHCGGTYTEDSWAMGERIGPYCRGCGRQEQAGA